MRGQDLSNMHSTRQSLPTDLSVSRFHCFLRASVLTLTLASPLAFAQDIALIPVRKSTTSLARRDESAPWNLNLKKDVVVHSPLLRLRDVAEPADPSSPWWDRPGAAIIGLMPIDDHEMIIDRERLIQAIERSFAKPDIQWSGATEVRVSFHREKISLDGAIPQALVDTPTVAASSMASKIVSVKPPMTPTERERVTRLIQYAIDRYDVKLRDAFEIEIDTSQASIDSLSDLRRVDTVNWEATPTEGQNLAKVIGVNSREPITALIEITLSARPLVVVTKEGIRRGQVISEADLELIPAARNVSADDVLTDINDAIGFQAQITLQKNRPIPRSSIAPVTVIERGELVELRVVGGGITVATGAKSLAPGAHGDLIPIETLDPRRKLMARVAGPGQVEILTRPPRVR
jgi:flagella basal body P-ring formation protein FlgA